MSQTNEPMEVLAISSPTLNAVQQFLESDTESNDTMEQNDTESDTVSESTSSLVSVESAAQQDSNDVTRCRICLEDIDEAKQLNEIVSPCRCAGTMGVMHIRCFRQLKTDYCSSCKFRFCFFDRDFHEKVIHMLELLEPGEEEVPIVNQLFPPQGQNPFNAQQFQNFLGGNLNDILQNPVINLDLHGNIFDILRNLVPFFPPFVPIAGGRFPIRNFVNTATRRVQNFWINIEGVRMAYFYILFIGEILKLPNGIWSVLYSLVMFNLMLLGVGWQLAKYTGIKCKNAIMFRYRLWRHPEQFQAAAEQFANRVAQPIPENPVIQRVVQNDGNQGDLPQNNLAEIIQQLHNLPEQQIFAEN